MSAIIRYGTNDAATPRIARITLPAKNARFRPANSRIQDKIPLFFSFITYLLLG